MNALQKNLLKLNKPSSQELLALIYRTVLGDFKTDQELLWRHRGGFVHSIKLACKAQYLDKRLCKKTFSLQKLSYALGLERDLILQSKYLTQISEQYLLKNNQNTWIETPQYFWMRVAMGQTLNKNDPTGSAIELYNQLSLLRLSYNEKILISSGRFVEE